MEKIEKIVDLEGLKELAHSLAKELKGNEVIFLIGDLGAGKTTFTQFLVEALQPTEEVEVRSPTFAVLNEYPTKKGTVYHADLYRVKNFDFTDFEGNGILIIEWADYLKDLRPDIVIKIQPVDENLRKVSIERKK
ncbi:MAG: tRNA (adenosine(37)-N6)-threonylcarbamoyltransferase complex ATPase subunit type 1 TsaE [Aquificae bacterium]|jgi:tRNA threonylcarbamoyladenosine biosynthesis protein TsaE|nr:tRNA (adenosine(37)-N6)-threonylcarbamoyltransferase complex ATPase subunit type 1 TsaE [Aquificota bacterium]